MVKIQIAKKKINLLNFLTKFELPLWFNCNQMDMKVVISIKYEWKYYCLGKNQASEAFCSTFTRSQSLGQLQNLNTLLKLWDQKNLCGQNFWNLILFFIQQHKVIDITRKKIKLSLHHLHT